jgi:apolipoprotein N-acyltransferase
MSPKSLRQATGQRFSPSQIPALGSSFVYEITFPQLARRLAHDGAEFLVNISNDGWIAQGGQAAVQQNFSLAVFRAVENKRRLVRVAAAGISGFIDAVGHPSKLSQEIEAVTLGEIVPQQTLTFYTQYGDWFAWSCFGVTGLVFIVAARSPARTPNTLRVGASV